MTAQQMRPRAELDFIRDRVLAEIRAKPSIRPYLGEEDVASRAHDTCRQGHPISGSGRQRRCGVCHAAWKQARRKGGSHDRH